MDDYYKTLGINEDASAEDIKSAYRRLAKQYHPDLNKGDAGAEAKFKQVNEANDTLSDPGKRAQYDQQRKFGGNPFGAHQHQQGFPGGFHFNFGGGMGAFDDMINQFFNQGFGRQQPQRNRDFQFAINISLEEAYVGKTMPVSFDANGQSRSVNVSIPAGVQSGTKLRYPGLGDHSIPGLPHGDLYVLVSINEHPVYRRDGPHLHGSLNIDVLQAITGTTAQIKAIDGQNIAINVPPGTQHGTTLRVAGRGMPAHNNSRQRGDIYLSINLQVPKDLDANEMLQIREMVNKREGKNA